MPNDSRPQTARNSPPPITDRSTSWWPERGADVLLDRIAWPTKNARKLVTSPATSATAPNTTPLAANSVPRLGMVVSEVLIMPVEYSDVIVSAPSTTMISWPISSPNRLMRPRADLISCSRWPGPRCAADGIGAREASCRCAMR